MPTPVITVIGESNMIERNASVRQKKRKQLILIGITVGFAAVFICSAYFILSAKLAEQRDKKAFEELIGQIEENKGTIANFPPTQEGNTEVEEVVESKYQTLFEENADFIGWICIDDTNINYPVMFTPNDPEYYLSRAFDGSKSKNGVPFLGENCTVDSNNILIYGHNMLNRTMFSDLLQYKDAEFGKDHSIIRFDTLTEEASYEVVAVFYSHVYAMDELGVFRYYDYGGELDKDTFTQYIDELRRAALYDTGVTPSYGDRLITLSTCSYHTSNGRFVVVARKIK